MPLPARSNPAETQKLRFGSDWKLQHKDLLTARARWRDYTGAGSTNSAAAKCIAD